MTLLLRSIVSVFALFIFAISVCAKSDDRPNLIVILADDMGFSDIGSYGGEIETPALDALADGGMKFSRFYNSARCCPTRASLMTGLHPHQTGIGWMTNPPNTGKMDHGPEFPNYRGFLNRDCVTLAEVLGDNGYATLMSGKWHLGVNDKSRWPLQRGFEKFYGSLAGATNFFYPEHPRGIWLGNEKVQNPESTTDRRYYTTDAFTDYALQFIEEEKANEDRPFFLYLAYTSPHWPLHAHQEEVQKYVGKYSEGWDQLREDRLKRQRELGLIDDKWKLPKRSHKAWEEMSEEKKKDMDLRMAYYAAMIDRMDQNIGKLVDRLKAMGKYENTLILFLSDNGACQEGGKLGGKLDPFDVDAWERTYGTKPSYGEVWANASNTPFRKFKHYTHEGGIGTPMIAHWPKGVKPQKDWYREPAYLIDLAPTFYDLAGTKYPKTYDGRRIADLPGVSLDAAFKGESLEREDPLFFEHEDHAAIMQGDWKLVGSNVSVPGGPNEKKWELYNMKKDRSETNNLAKKKPELVANLAAEWLEWANEVGVYPKPEKRTTDN
ncbi:arylsulfatase [Pelagicoccus mobilis]|uniref:Arylsulfatase n=1 Tax=Pelagicoccus mobilis TaxID=415221 RepID=A0A934S2A4_9BACT|nr:arylsulfatase [Pelagicoccus mobilis]MBK1879764.1 arylsulfatase [Pelagicoccus mobilis]